MQKSPSVDDRTPEDVTSSLLCFDEEYMKFPIRNVYELLLYLPLIDEKLLQDVVYRCYGNYGPTQRDYVMHQLSFLHRSIPESPEKSYADYCRDNELRVKGDRPFQFDSVNGESEYWSKLYSYRNTGNHTSLGEPPR